MKFTQLKEFNSKTVTQEIAGEICSLVAWNHLNEEKYRKSLIIEDSACKGVHPDGGGSSFPWRDSMIKDGYIKTGTGVTITSPQTHELIRISETGSCAVYYTRNKFSEYETVIRKKKDRTERIEDRVAVVGSNQVKLIALYIEYGFLTPFKL